MRVITGKARGTRLLTPPGLDTRPTIERVKEAVFSSLYYDIAGAKVLDLYAGSGQMGIEALSRGASHAVFVDTSKDSLMAIDMNIKKTHLEADALVKNAEVRGFLEREKGQYDLVLMDPPYGKNLVNEAMKLLAERNLLSERAVVVCESEDKDNIDEKFGDFHLAKQARYGRVKISYFRKQTQEES